MNGIGAKMAQRAYMDISFDTNGSLRWIVFTKELLVKCSRILNDDMIDDNEPKVYPKRGNIENPKFQYRDLGLE